MSGRAGCLFKANKPHQGEDETHVSVALVRRTTGAVVAADGAAAPERFAPRLCGFGYWSLIGLVRLLADDGAAPAIISFV